MLWSTKLKYHLMHIILLGHTGCKLRINSSNTVFIIIIMYIAWDESWASWVQIWTHIERVSEQESTERENGEWNSVIPESVGQIIGEDQEGEWESGATVDIFTALEQICGNGGQREIETQGQWNSSSLVLTACIQQTAKFALTTKPWFFSPQEFPAIYLHTAGIWLPWQLT